MRFSIDDVATTLKISKKTIYKYFASKEELAVAIYEKYYHDADKQLQEMIAANENDLFKELLLLYYQSFCMVRKEIFNKYALNKTIRERAMSCHEHIWQGIRSILPPQESEILKTIIDGAFEKFDNRKLSLTQMIEKLQRLV